MKILSPLSKAEEVLPLIEAGAEEFYCGVVTREWEKSFSYIASSNLRHDKVANFSSFEGLAEAVKAASSRKVPVFCTFNSLFYSEKQLPLLLEQIGQAEEAGISKVIVSDIGLIHLLREKGIGVEVALSTAACAFNSQSFSLFKELGIKRIVLPRHLTVGEISNLASKAKPLLLELEAFVLNALCPFIDGLCTLQHFGKGSNSISHSELACRLPFEIETVSNRGGEEVRRASSKAAIWQNTFTTGCGLCALPSFKKAGISSLKIAGRGNSTEKKVSDVTMLKHALSLLSLPEKDFKEEMKGLFFDANHSRCNSRECYYFDAGGF